MKVLANGNNRDRFGPVAFKQKLSGAAWFSSHDIGVAKVMNAVLNRIREVKKNQPFPTFEELQRERMGLSSQFSLEDKGRLADCYDALCDYVDKLHKLNE